MARGNVSRYLLYEGGTLMLSLKNECQFRVMEMVSVEWLSGVAQWSIGSMLHAAVPAKIKVGRV